VTILTTVAILLSNARTRRQETLEAYTLVLVEDCDFQGVAGEVSAVSTRAAGGSKESPLNWPHPY